MTRTDAMQRIKCLVWDLDNTLWDGVLLEGDDVRLRSGVLETLHTLDERGVLHSIASRNDHEAAMAVLKRFELDHYFLYPQIGWGAKSASIEAIQRQLNIGINAFAFIDDQPFELAEVTHSLPEVLCVPADQVDRLCDRPEFIPRFVTDESKRRRSLYQADIDRRVEESSFEGASQDFLSTLDLHLSLRDADEQDLARVEELTVRTHQLNATGYTYSFEELEEIRRCGQHTLIVAELRDRFGSYGKIGVALVERGEHWWTLKLLLMSCRVMSRGVGTLMLNFLINQAHDAGVALRAEFVPNDRNRAMHIAYRFAGFRELRRDDKVVTFEHATGERAAVAPYATLHAAVPSLTA